MNDLPQVLQKEIWEYVRGDRAYFKQQFSKTVLRVITTINQHLRNKIAAFPNGFIVEARFGDTGIVLDNGGCSGRYFMVRIRKYDDSLPLVPWTTQSTKWDLTREEAVKFFYEKVEIEAINRA
jgi:hypothetical protein